MLRGSLGSVTRGRNDEALFLYPMIPPFHNHTECDQSATALTENIAYGAQYCQTVETGGEKGTLRLW